MAPPPPCSPAPLPPASIYRIKKQLAPGDKLPVYSSLAVFEVTVKHLSLYILIQFGTHKAVNMQIFRN